MTDTNQTGNRSHVSIIEKELNLKPAQVGAVANLLAEGATVPFIARYRKEATGSLDEVAITAIRDRLQQLAELDNRRETILNSLAQNGHLTDELRTAVEGAQTMAELEDIYLPYRPKRRTKATIAREKGLEPLALAILAQNGVDVEARAAEFVDPEKEVTTADDALEGARHIIAEIVNEDADARAEMRDLFLKKATIRSVVSAGKEEEGAKYKDYFDWEEPLATAPSHRVLAMRRGEKEEVLNLTVAPPEDAALELLRKRFVTGSGPDSAQVELAIHDGYKRLLSRSMETETRLWAKERADAEAIRVFAENLRELLLASPLGARRIMAIDPGFRTGCKIACLDRQGKFLHNDTIYLHKEEEAITKLRKLAEKFQVEAVAVGNGTASRETESLARRGGLPAEIPVVMVNESGASIYSASEAARDEFPDLDLTVRGAISIGRRLMDPLAELVKIDPKSIGVGQYQHDVDQTALKQSLDDVVISCVNRVGVDVNRASAQLLSYVSGLGPALAKKIVAHRDENGPFQSREVIKSVKRLGPKAFEQCAGFLRISDGENPLDASAVHPESYHIVERMTADLDCTVGDLMKQAELRERIRLSDYVTDTIGLPTLRDIMDELAKPGRDPRKAFEHFAFASGVKTMEDLEPGMKLPGIVTNVTAFGAFVDIGVHQDGLVHISELADRFVKDPAEVVKVHQKVEVTVMEVDIERKRIGLSMKSQPGSAGRRERSKGAEEGKTERPLQRGKKKRGAAGKEKPDRNAPFNNPFADALGKLK